MTVKIERVDSIALRIPYDHWAPKPTFGGIARTTMDCLLVRVTASNGMIGWGEAFWGGWQATQTALEHWIGPLSVGQDAADTGMTARFERALHNFGRSGPYVYALAGLNIALWDLRGKLEGVPVHALLAGKKRGRVAVYASLLAYGGNVENVKRNTARALERGYRQIKLHEKTAEALAISREVAGADIPIMVDTNCAWLPDAAHDAIMAMKPYDPLWVEEPIWPPEDVASLGVLRRATGVPLAAGENATGALEFVNLVAAGVDYVQPSAVKNGNHGDVGDLPERRGVRCDLRAAFAVLWSRVPRDIAYPRRQAERGRAGAFLLRSRSHAVRRKRPDRQWLGADPGLAGPRSRSG
jgi:L-alanine-DL-glutamate epimerase-like enolase superfamily enzyme